MEHPVWNFHPDLGAPQRKKPDLLAEAGPNFCNLRLSFFVLTLFLDANGYLLRLKTRRDQPRVRERIMKLSKVYSATCHHRY
jgi:hypothetical protein